VKAALLRYRVMANVVGVLLIVLVLVGLPLHYGYLVLPEAMPKGGSAWQWGADISRYLGVAHGWLYMIFLITAFLLSRKAKWDLGFTAVTLLCGTVPILSFWAEHRATRQVKAQLAATAPAGTSTVPG
jgi:integral membrane protein